MPVGSRFAPRRPSGDRLSHSRQRPQVRCAAAEASRRPALRRWRVRVGRDELRQRLLQRRPLCHSDRGSLRRGRRGVQRVRCEPRRQLQRRHLQVRWRGRLWHRPEMRGWSVRVRRDQLPDRLLREQRLPAGRSTGRLRLGPRGPPELPDAADLRRPGVQRVRCGQLRFGLLPHRGVPDEFARQLWVRAARPVQRHLCQPLHCRLVQVRHEPGVRRRPGLRWGRSCLQPDQLPFGVGAAARACA